MDDQQPTNQEILDAINSFSSDNDRELAEIKRTMITEEKLDARLDIKLDAKLKEKFADFESRLETRFITKEFFVDKLDEKFAEFRLGLVTMLRQEDTKLGTLTKKLGARKVLPLTDVNEVLAMEPFPVGK